MIRPSTSNEPPEVQIAFGGDHRPLSQLGLQRLDIQHHVNRIPSARIVYSPTTGNRTALPILAEDTERCNEGEDVEIRLSSGEVLFRGLIVSQQVQIQENRTELVLKARHSLYKLTAVPRTGAYIDKGDATIIREILARHNVSLKSIEGVSDEGEQAIQLRTPDWTFLKQRLQSHPVWLLPTPSNVTVAPPSVSAGAKHIIEHDHFDIGPGSIEGISWQYRLLPTLEVAHSSWQIDDQKMSAARPVRPLSIGRGGLDPASLNVADEGGWTEFHDERMTPAAENARSRADLLADLLASISLELTTVGTIVYSLGDTIQTKGFGGRLDGAGIISGIIHRLTPAQWRTTVSIGSESPFSEDHARRNVIDSVHIGTVASREDDPKKLGRVRVTLAMLGPASPAIWARPATPFAGKVTSFVFQPEPGDEVLIGFVSGQESEPLILGAVFNPTSPAPLDAAKGDLGIVMSSGDYRQALIFNVAEKQLVLETNEGRLTLGSTTSLGRNDGASLTLSEDIAVSGASAAIKADRAFKVEANEAEIKGSASVKVKGASIDLTQS